MQKYLKLTRIHRPAGIFLLFLPCLFAIFFTFSGEFSKNLAQIVNLCLLFGLGSVIMRSAGCVINDIFDQKFDKKVARTKNRPLANGELKNSQALSLLIILLIFGLVILLQFSQKTVISGIFALILVILYPLMKRITFYPQIFLGIVFNFGIIIASLEIKGFIAIQDFLLYVSCIIWTLIYDSIYAFQDIEDDVKIGVKSSAIRLAKNPKKILSLLVISQFILLFLAGFVQKTSFYFFFIEFLAFFHLLWLVNNCDYKNSKDCLDKFKANIVVGVVILAGIFIG